MVTATWMSRWRRRTAPTGCTSTTGTGKLSHTPGAFGSIEGDNEHVRVADFNGDGHLDVVFVAEDTEQHNLFLGDGKAGFTRASERLPATSQATRWRSAM